MDTPAAPPVPSLHLVSPAIPPEIILKIVQHLPFDTGRDIIRLQHVHPRLRALLLNYEHSLTRTFMRRELSHASTDFPCCAKFGYRCLAECVRRYDIVDDVMDALSSRQNCYAVPAYNMALANTGLLLLYRVASLDSREAKLEYINSLPLDPLTAIYLTIHHTTLTARYHGSGWIHQRTYGRFMDSNQLSLRSELEFCFAEACLDLGPEFISDSLLHWHTKPGAEASFLNFYVDHGTHDWEWPGWGEGEGEFNPPRVQGPQVKPESGGRTFFTTLLERLAECAGTSLDEVRARIEEQTTDPEHALAWVNLHGKARLMAGRNWDWAEEDGEQKSERRRDSVHS